MPKIDVQGIGVIEFPDDMPPDAIQKSIETELLPRFPEVAAKANRSWGEAATDVGAGLLKGAGNILQIPGQLSRLAGLEGSPEQGLEGIGKNLESFGQEAKSTRLKGKESLQQQKVDTADGEFSKFWQSIKGVATDPALAVNFISEQVPNLLGTMGGGLLARGGVNLLMKNATMEALGKAGISGAVGTGAIMQGADIGSDTYERIRSELIKDGVDPEEANQTALIKGREAAINAGLISVGTAFLPGGTTIERALAGKGAPGVGGFTRGLLGESFSEGVEETGGQFVGNLATQQVLPETSLTQGLGQAAGLGVLAGGFFGGPAGAINARSDAKLKAQLDVAKQMSTEAKTLAENVEDDLLQARRDAYAVEQAEMRQRIDAERFQGSQAYADLSKKIDAMKAKAQASKDKYDAKMSEFSAFTDSNPDLFGLVVPEQEVTGVEQENAPQISSDVPAGQLALPLTDEAGQLGMPEFGGAQPSTVAPAPIVQIEEDFVNYLGIPKGAKKVRAALLGKDLGDPVQLTEVRGALEDYANVSSSTGVINRIEEFLTNPAFGVQQELSFPARTRTRVKKVLQEGLPQTQGVQDATTESSIDGQSGERSVEVADMGSAPTAPPTDTSTGTTGPRGRGLADVNAGARTNAPRSQPPSDTLNAESIAPTNIFAGKTLTSAQTQTAEGYENTYATLTKSNPSAASVSALSTPKNKILATPNQKLLELIAADIYSNENNSRRKANSLYKSLPAESQSYIESVVDSFKAMETRGAAFVKLEEQKKLADREFQRSLDIDDMDTPSAARAEPTGRISPKLLTAVYSGRTLDALKEIASNPLYNVLERSVAQKFVNSKISKLPNLEVVAGDVMVLEGASGQYQPYTDTVQIVSGEVDSHTVLHEVTHAFLHALVTQFERGRLSTPSLVNLQKIYEHIKNVAPELIARKDTSYGLSSLTEFSAEVMSNPEFQAALRNIPYDNRNAFAKFVQYVMELFGVQSNKNTALAEALIQADNLLNAGRNLQQNVFTGSKRNTSPTAPLVRNDLEDISKRAGGIAETPPPKRAFQSAKEAVTKDNVSKFLDKLETKYFSFDAGFSNAVRDQLETNNPDWAAVKDDLLSISTSQALHADGIAIKFLEKGNVRYNKELSKFEAIDDKDNYITLVNELKSIAIESGVPFDTLKQYANQAFIADRISGMSKTDKDFYSNLTPAQVQAGLEFFKAIPRLRDVQNIWNGIRKNAMAVAVDSGLYSEKESKDLLNVMDYVPFFREDQIAAGAGPREFGRGLLDFAKSKKIRGSDQKINDIFDNMERWTSYTVSRAVKNRTANNMLSISQKLFPTQVKQLRQDEPVRMEERNNVIDIYVNGQRKKFKFSDPLFVQAFGGMEGIASPLLSGIAGKGATKAANFLRKSIVLVPLFSISQLSQDSVSAMFTSGLKSPMKLPFEVVKEFINTLRGTSATHDRLSNFAATGVRDYSAVIARSDVELKAGLQSETKGARVMSALEKFAMASDNAVRQAIYNQTLLETGGVRAEDGSIRGGDEATAIERAFEVINFKRSGNSGVVQVAKQVIPFFGAYLQAMNVMYKIATGRGISPQQRAEARANLLSTSIKVAALAFLYTALASDDNEYVKMDRATRDRSLIIPGTSFKLPLRPDLFLLPKMIGEYAYLGVTDNGFTDGKKVRAAFRDAIVNSILSPTAVPQAIKPILEVGINYSFFTGRPIIGQGLERLPTDQQTSIYSSELAKMMGSTGLIAPVNADHLMRGYFGTVGGLLNAVISSVVRTVDGRSLPEVPTADALGRVPGLSPFLAKEYGTGVKNDFYELQKEVDVAVAGFNRLKKYGTIADAQEFAQENKELIGLRTQVNRIQTQLAKLRGQERKIIEAPDSVMDAAQKGEAVARIKAQEERMRTNVYTLRGRAGF